MASDVELLYFSATFNSEAQLVSNDFKAKTIQQLQLSDILFVTRKISKARSFLL